MSYSGSFATERLWEVAPGGDASKGSWVVPEDVMKGPGGEGLRDGGG